MRKQIEVLEHHAHFAAELVYIAAGSVDLRPFKPHLAPGGHFQQVQAAEKGALSGAGRPHDHHLFPFLNLLVDPLEHMKVAPQGMERLFQIFNAYHFNVYHSGAASFRAWTGT